MNTTYYLPNAMNSTPNYLSKKINGKKIVFQQEDKYLNKKIEISEDINANSIAREFHDLQQRISSLNALKEQIRTLVKSNLIDPNQLSSSLPFPPQVLSTNVLITS